jgi:acyl carrier protein
MSDVENKVRKIVAEQLDVKENDISESSRFVEDLGADSLGQIELIMALEEEFGCEIPDEEAQKLTTFGEALNYIKERI